MHVKTIALAREFGSRVQEIATRSEFREILDRNKAETDEGVCHTHDFWDANETMLEAFRTVMQREPTFLADMNDETDCEIWRDAWAIAIAADFFA
jgi:hypothetical protein